MADDFTNKLMKTETDFTDRDIRILDWLEMQGFLTGKGKLFLRKVALDRAVNNELNKRRK